MWKNHRMTFPDQDPDPRTNVRFDEMRCAEHHRGASILTELNLGMVTQFPSDYMHLICLGIVKKLITMWTNGPVQHIKIGNAAVGLISDSILHLKSYLPREFIRKGRSLKEVDRWKATEFRTFLLYTGLVSLKGKLPPVIYGNFLLLFVGVTILSSVDLCIPYCDYAEHVLSSFVNHFGEAYGTEHLIYNIHTLTHLASQVM